MWCRPRPDLSTCGEKRRIETMTFKNLGISKKIGLLVVVIGLSSLIIAAVSGSGLYGLQKAMSTVGAQEEVAREAMDLRVDIIAVSRMTYQLAARSEERRVGKECVRPGRLRWGRDHKKKKKR